MGDIENGAVCHLCKQIRTEYALVYLRVGSKEVSACACRECFDGAMRRQTAFRLMISNFLPEEWKGVLLNG